jgi:hypothetical protein
LSQTITVGSPIVSARRSRTRTSAGPRQRAIDFDGRTFVGEVVDDVQGAEAATIAERE